MPGKRRRDYKKVFRAATKLLPSVSIQTITIDFEAAMWQALHRVLPTVWILGCFFHWTQAVWRKVQALGLQVIYSNDNATHKYIRKLLSMPYLPAQHIQPIFTKLQEKAATPPLQDLTHYIQTTWLSNPFWSTRAWSTFGCHTRTNNDVEGWHYHMNLKAKKGQLSFYVQLQLLHEESQQVDLQVHLISEAKLKCQECLKYCTLQSSLFKL